MVSFVYLRLFIFLPAILIPACASSSSTFFMVYSEYKLNKQGDNIQPWRTPFPIWNQSVMLFYVQFFFFFFFFFFMSSSNCCFLTCIQVSQEAGQVVWYSHLFQNFPYFIVECFGLVNKTEMDVFLELYCFFDDPADVGNLISGSFAFSKASLNSLQIYLIYLYK